MNALELSNKVSEFKGRLWSAKKELETSTKNLEDSKRYLEAANGLKAVIQQVAKETQDKLRLRFEAIVQACLDAVFPSCYTFKMEFISRRGQVEVDMWLDSEGTRMDPLDSNGGGVVDVMSIALRLCCLTLSTNEKVLLLDEPFGHLRGEARERLGELLTIISEKLNVQILMVGDVAGNVVRGKEFKVSKVGDISVVKESA
jgi:DNA repair exonuclease SbcCD ATPase subunit